MIETNPDAIAAVHTRYYVLIYFICFTDILCSSLEDDELIIRRLLVFV